MNTTRTAHLHSAQHSNSRKLFKRSLLSLAVTMTLTAPAAMANPTNPVVVNGDVTFNQSGSTLTVTNTPNAIINWGGFSIAQDEITRFIQQSSSSSVLNRVVGQDPSQILGQLQSNGRIFLINPNGVLFGESAQVDVGSLIVSTLNISNDDFLNGNLSFSGDGSEGRVENAGELTSATGGQIFLIAPSVENSGIIHSPEGEILLTAGHTVEITDSLNPALRVEVTAPEGEVINIGQMIAEGGSVGIYAPVIQNSGYINATSLVADGGKIYLRATQSLSLDETSHIEADGTQGGEVTALVADSDGLSGEINVAGTISAQGDGSEGSGGFVETSAASVQINEVAVNTGDGTWLIDPNDFTIAASGGNITGATLSSNLGGGNVIIESSSGTVGGSGDININDTVSWSANNLTLTAARDININNVMTASGTSSLTMNTATANGADAAVIGGAVKVGFDAVGDFAGRVDFPGRSGAGFLTINGQSYTVINALGLEGSVTGTDLQGMDGDLAGFYALGSDIDATSTAAWNAGAGFDPVGLSTATAFSGSFNGLGHTVDGLTINRPGVVVGLLYTSEIFSEIRNIGLTNESIVGGLGTGGLIGYVGPGGIVSNAYNTGTVTGDWAVGGLIGQIDGTVSDSHSSATVSANDTVGGLIGYATGGSITNSYATGTVTGVDFNIGGLVGYNLADLIGTYATGQVTATAASSFSIGGLIGSHDGGTLSNSYATGHVIGTTSSTDIGGLVGITDSIINQSYATGNVNGGWEVGGFAGSIIAGSQLTDIYATGTVYGELDSVGGLVGRMFDGTIDNAYSIGAVSGGTGATNLGGMIGRYGTGTITASYWDLNTSGQATSAGTEIGQTTAQLQDVNFITTVGWDPLIWVMDAYPSLLYFGAPIIPPVVTPASPELLATEVEQLALPTAIATDLAVVDVYTPPPSKIVLPAITPEQAEILLITSFDEQFFTGTSPFDVALDEAILSGDFNSAIEIMSLFANERDPYNANRMLCR